MIKHKDSLLGARQVARTTVSHCVALLANVQSRGLNSSSISRCPSTGVAFECNEKSMAMQSNAPAAAA